MVQKGLNPYTLHDLEQSDAVGDKSNRSVRACWVRNRGGYHGRRTVTAVAT